MPHEIWKPNSGPQEEALRRAEFEVLYGGARGGGKTDAGLVWLTEHIKNPRFRALVIRKNADDLSDWVDRANRMYQLLGAKSGYKPTVIKFPSGAIIRTGHLKDDNAYTKYQGHEYQAMLIEEVTQIPSEKRYLQLLGSCRSTVDGIRPQIFLTTNPDGVGHGWVKARFIDPMPPNTPYKYSHIMPDGTKLTRSRVFIPAKLEDNPALLEKDPEYVVTLEMIKHTDPDLYEAWRNGNWDIFAGQYFKEFRREKHVIKQFTPNYKNKEITFMGGLDWGRANPFAFLASLIMKVRWRDIDFYRVITFDETYGTDKRPEEWSQIIKKKIPLESLSWVQCDGQIFDPLNDNSVSIAEQFGNDENHWRVVMQRASKDRIGGWEYMHKWLSLAPDGLPYWLITDNCINLIRTLPELVHDENIKEDVNSEGEDHAPDAARYMLKQVRWVDAMAGALKYKEREKLTYKSPVPMFDTTHFEHLKQERPSEWDAVK